MTVRSASFVPVCYGLWYYKRLLVPPRKGQSRDTCDIPTFLYAPRAPGLGAISGLIWKRAAGTTVLTHANADVCEELCCDPEIPCPGYTTNTTTHRKGTFRLISASRQLDSTRCGVALFSFVGSNNPTLAQHWASWMRYFSTIQGKEI